MKKKGQTPFLRCSSKRCLSLFFVRGLTLLELILVMVIIAIGGALAYPKLEKSVENRQAREALKTLRSISHAERMYQVDHDGQFTDDINVLINDGYLKESEFYKNGTLLNYTVGTPDGFAQAAFTNGRQIDLEQDGTVTDSTGFLN